MLARTRYLKWLWKPQIAVAAGTLWLVLFVSYSAITYGYHVLDSASSSGGLVAWPLHALILSCKTLGFTETCPNGLAIYYFGGFAIYFICLFSAERASKLLMGFMIGYCAGMVIGTGILMILSIPRSVGQGMFMLAESAAGLPVTNIVLTAALVVGSIFAGAVGILIAGDIHDAQEQSY